MSKALTPPSPMNQPRKVWLSPHDRAVSSAELSPWGSYALKNFTRLISALSKDSHRYHELADVAWELLTEGRIEQISGSNLARIANGVSKLTTPDYQSVSEPLMRQLAQVVCAADANDRERWTVLDLAMMANAFGSVQGYIFVEALQTISDEIQDRGPRLDEADGWDLQSLAMTAVALGKVARDRYVAEVLGMIARESVRRLEEYAGQWSVQQLAMVVGGISRAMDGEAADAIGKALQTIAGEVGHRLQHRQAEAWTWTVRQLSMLASAFGRTDGRRTKQALNLLAREALNWLQNGKLRQWSVSNLAIFANGIEKGEGKYIEKTLRVMARLITDRDSGLRVNSDWSSQDLAMMAGALTKVDSTDVQAALKSIARELLKQRHRCESAPRRWSAAQLAKVANSMIKVPGDRDAIKVLKVVADAVHRQKLALRDAQQWTAKNLNKVGRAISTIEGRRAQRALRSVAKAVVHRRRDLGRAAQWGEKQLGIIANAISNGEGKEARQALKAVARAVIRRGPDLKNQSCWTPRYLALTAASLSKITDDSDAIKALLLIAEAIADPGRQRDREKCDREQWCASSLTMAANVLGKVEGDYPAITRAMIRLAEEFVHQEHDISNKQEWSEQNLSLLANAFGKVEGQAIFEAQACIGREITIRERDLHNREKWPVYRLALVATAICKAPGEVTHRAVATIARAVARQGLTLRDKHIWSVKHLAMMAYGLSKIRQSEAFEVQNMIADAVLHRLLHRGEVFCPQSLTMLASGLYLDTSLEALELVVDLAVKQTDKDPVSLSWLLVRMSSWHLLDRHLQVAVKMFQALESVHFRPDDRRTVEELLWVSTLMHFSSTHQPTLASYFEQQYARYLAQLPTGAVPDEDQEDSRGRVYSSQWHGIFARDYWDKNPSRPDVEKDPSALQDNISLAQRRVYQALRTNFHENTVATEVRINKFPVDVLLGEKVCIEVDGSSHFVPCSTCSTTADRGCSLAKDRFIDHMLARYDIKIFRFSFDGIEDSRCLQKLVEDIVASGDLK